MGCEATDTLIVDHAALNGGSGSGAEVVWSYPECLGENWTGWFYGYIASAYNTVKNTDWLNAG